MGEAQKLSDRVRNIGEAVGASDRLRGRRDGMEYQLFRKAYGEKGTSETWLVS